MKQITIALALLLAVAALWLTGDRLSAEALAMLIGVLLGISTSIPIALYMPLPNPTNTAWRAPWPIRQLI